MYLGGREGSQDALEVPASLPTELFFQLLHKIIVGICGLLDTVSRLSWDLSHIGSRKQDQFSDYSWEKIFIWYNTLPTGWTHCSTSVTDYFQSRKDGSKQPLLEGVALSFVWRQGVDGQVTLPGSSDIISGILKSPSKCKKWCDQTLFHWDKPGSFARFNKFPEKQLVRSFGRQNNRGRWILDPQAPSHTWKGCLHGTGSATCNKMVKNAELSELQRS